MFTSGPFKIVVRLQSLEFAFIAATMQYLSINLMLPLNSTRVKPQSHLPHEVRMK